MRRPWYRRKRFVVPLVVAVVAIAVGAGDGQRRAERQKPSSTCLVTYPDQQPTDVCAGSSGGLTLADMHVSAGGLSRSSRVLGVEICVDLELRNVATRSKDFSPWDFRLQTPGGEVKSFEWTAQTTLRRGVLVAGGTTSGRVCFSDAAEAGGQFVLIYKPSALSKTRGTWLLRL